MTGAPDGFSANGYRTTRRHRALWGRSTFHSYLPERSAPPFHPQVREKRT